MTPHKTFHTVQRIYRDKISSK